MDVKVGNKIGLRPVPELVMGRGPPGQVLPAQLLKRLLLHFHLLEKHELMQRVLGTKQKKEETIGKLAEYRMRNLLEHKDPGQLRGEREERKFRKRMVKDVRKFLEPMTRGPFTTGQLQLEPIRGEVT
jgi:hypothetical protein